MACFVLLEHHRNVYNLLDANLHGLPMSGWEEHNNMFFNRATKQRFVVPAAQKQPDDAYLTIAVAI